VPGAEGRGWWERGGRNTAAVRAGGRGDEAPTGAGGTGGAGVTRVTSGDATRAQAPGPTPAGHPSPAAVTPAAVTPAAVTPAAVTSSAVTSSALHSPVHASTAVYLLSPVHGLEQPTPAAAAAYGAAVDRHGTGGPARGVALRRLPAPAVVPDAPARAVPTAPRCSAVSALPVHQVAGGTAVRPFILIRVWAIKLTRVFCSQVLSVL
jgi:hypothetical protein